MQEGTNRVHQNFLLFKCVIFTNNELLISIRDYQPIKTHVLRDI